jgi:type IV pilus assembly protein PilY1
MQKRNIGLILVLCGFLLLPLMSQADDVEIYKATAKNNAMLIMDLTGSMNFPIYEESVDYQKYWVDAMAKSGIKDNSTSATTGRLIKWQKNLIYLVQVDVGFKLVKDNVITGDVFMTQRSIASADHDSLRQLLDYPIYNSGATYSDLTDPAHNTIVTSGVSVVYPSGVSGLLPINNHITGYPNKRLSYGSTTYINKDFLNQRAILLQKLVTDPITNEESDRGLLGYLRAPGIYYIGLFPLTDNNTNLILTDNVASALNVSGRERCMAYVTGNFLYFCKIVVDLYYTSSSSYAWQSLAMTDASGNNITIRSRLQTSKSALNTIVDQTISSLRWSIFSFKGSTYTNEVAYDTSAADLKSKINGFSATGGTTIGIAMQRAYNYTITQFNAKAPPTCAQNFNVLLTDGFSTTDDKTWNLISWYGKTKTFTDEDGDDWCGDPVQGASGTKIFADDVARWLRNSGVTITGRTSGVTVTTHTIGFGLENPLLQDIADDSASTMDPNDNIRGVHITAYNEQQLVDAFRKIGILTAASNSFVAPVVSVDTANRTQSGDEMFMAFFKPSSFSYWSGNLKKYGIANIGGLWRVVDRNGTTATEDTGEFKSTAQSFWSTEVDGDAIDKGGAGEAILNSMPDLTSPTVTYYDHRNIKTYLGGALTPFNPTTITNANLGASDDKERYKIINFIYGYTYDAKLVGVNYKPVAKRSWVLGDMIHNEPCLIEYYDAAGNVEKRIIAIGANDGMLHFFQDNIASNTIEELWAFIPPDLLPKLKTFGTANTHNYFLDGSCTLRVTPRGAKMLVFGERRGGTSYWALDVTDKDWTNWEVKWHIDPTTTGFSELKYTWSLPTPGQIMVSGVTKDVLIFGGGYDEKEDGFPEKWDDVDKNGRYNSGESITHSTGGTAGAYDYFNPGLDDYGRGIFVVDILDGTRLFSITYDASTTDLTGNTQKTPEMKWCFPADPSVISIEGRLLIYQADMYGQIWKLTYDYSQPTNKWQVTRVFQANPGSNQTPTTLLSFINGTSNAPLDVASDKGRKTFYSPDVSYRGNDWTDYPVLFFGTGDREHPRVMPPTGSIFEDRIYSVSDTGELANEKDLLNVTCNPLQQARSGVTAWIDVNLDGESTPEDIALQQKLKEVLFGGEEYQTGKICRGWYRKLTSQAKSFVNGGCYKMTDEQAYMGDHEGEKVLSRPTLFYKVVWFTTYKPVCGPDAECNPTGNSFIYALDYSYGGAAVNFNQANTDFVKTMSISDTFVLVEQTGIASKVKIIIKDADATGFISAGGKLLTVDPPQPPGGVSRKLWKTLR